MIRRVVSLLSVTLAVASCAADEEPPFRLELAPADVSVKPGTSAPIEVKVVRREDFQGLVSIGAEDREGVHLSFNGSHASGMSAVESGATFAVSVATNAKNGTVPIPFEGSAMGDANVKGVGQLVVRIE